MTTYQKNLLNRLTSASERLQRTCEAAPSAFEAEILSNVTILNALLRLEGALNELEESL